MSKLTHRDVGYMLSNICSKLSDDDEIEDVLPSKPAAPKITTLTTQNPGFARMAESAPSARPAAIGARELATLSSDVKLLKERSEKDTSTLQALLQAARKDLDHLRDENYQLSAANNELAETVASQAAELKSLGEAISRIEEVVRAAGGDLAKGLEGNVKSNQLNVSDLPLHIAFDTDTLLRLAFEQCFAL